MIDRAAIVVAAATPLEAREARRALPGMRVVETGVALRRAYEPLGDVVISCGLAGGLHHAHPTGTVIVPHEVARPNGEIVRCDAALSGALRAAARSLGLEPSEDRLVTTDAIVRGAQRDHWASQGFAAVDMETGLLRAQRVAAVRVILDTPLRELSEEWLRPVTAALKPWNWPELIWLARTAPRCARLAAQVIARAFLP